MGLDGIDSESFDSCNSDNAKHSHANFCESIGLETLLLDLSCGHIL